MKHYSVLLLVVTGWFAFVSMKLEPTVAPKLLLSEYGFFSGNLRDQVPAKGVTPYSLNTPLFSDYAEKSRFVYLPEGTAAEFDPAEVFRFPEGAVLIKTFYFPKDFRNPSKGKRLVETRLLLREKSGWKALTYVWDEAQNDAVLEVAGETFQVSYTYLDGKKYRHQFQVPNLNQCKGCHNLNETLQPLGPSARQLNGSYSGWGQSPSGKNQLSDWQEKQLLTALPDPATIEKAPVWSDESSGSLSERARAWLDVNCAHCHRPGGPANSSGLHLGVHNSDSTLLGINKTPVAAGRGSGGRKFDIVMGKPDESILQYRIESGDPGVMMPELGRSVMHREGAATIRAWIRSLERSAR